MPEVRAGDYWIVGFSTGDGGLSYTVMEVLATSGGKLTGFVCGSEEDFPMSSVDEWVRKVAMPC